MTFISFLIRILISSTRPHSHDIIEPQLALPRYSLPPSNITLEIKHMNFTMSIRKRNQQPNN